MKPIHFLPMAAAGLATLAVLIGIDEYQEREARAARVVAQAAAVDPGQRLRVAALVKDLPLCHDVPAVGPERECNWNGAPAIKGGSSTHVHKFFGPGGNDFTLLRKLEPQMTITRIKPP
ncbi:MAG TPA: hypothetical protein VNU71_13445 [Burkholderiaceae bacterium]|nr:hypothetical protein [Burkholderiaceae bacterium]